MQFDEQYLKLLGKAGFLALGNGTPAKAETIFIALALVSPNKVAPIVGSAITLLHKDDVAGAIAKLENEALTKDPGDPFAQTYLGLALHLATQTDRAKIVLQGVVSTNADSTATDLAKGLLAEMG